MVFVLVVNLIAAGLQAVIGLFISGFHLGRIERTKRGEPKSIRTAVGGFATLLAVLGLVFLLPELTNRNVTLVAEDGHSLPFAALIVHTGSGDLHRRTDNSGNTHIPRFGTRAITVKDPRYVETTWAKSEIESQLMVRRTVLGSGLDSLAGKLLKPAKE